MLEVTWKRLNTETIQHGNASKKQNHKTNLMSSSLNLKLKRHFRVEAFPCWGVSMSPCWIIMRNQSLRLILIQMQDLKLRGWKKSHQGGVSSILYSRSPAFFLSSFFLLFNPSSSISSKLLSRIRKETELILNSGLLAKKGESKSNEKSF